MPYHGCRPELELDMMYDSAPFRVTTICNVRGIPVVYAWLKCSIGYCIYVIPLSIPRCLLLIVKSSLLQCGDSWKADIPPEVDVNGRPRHVAEIEACRMAKRDANAQDEVAARHVAVHVRSSSGNVAVLLLPRVAAKSIKCTGRVILVVQPAQLPQSLSLTSSTLA